MVSRNPKREDYLAECEAWSESEAEFARWERLWPILGSRSGWYFKGDEYTSPAWCYGRGGECRIVITVTEDSFQGYDPLEDTQVNVGGEEELVMWFEPLEPKYAGLSDVAKGLMDHLAEQWSPDWERQFGEESPG